MCIKTSNPSLRILKRYYDRRVYYLIYLYTFNKIYLISFINSVTLSFYGHSMSLHKSLPLFTLQ